MSLPTASQTSTANRQYHGAHSPTWSQNGVEMDRFSYENENSLCSNYSRAAYLTQIAVLGRSGYARTRYQFLPWKAHNTEQNNPDCDRHSPTECYNI